VARRRSRSRVGARPGRFEDAFWAGVDRGFAARGAAFAALVLGFGDGAARLATFALAALVGAFAALVGFLAFFALPAAALDRVALALGFGRAAPFRAFVLVPFDAFAAFVRDLAMTDSFTLTG
jgi:hypothetical protein